MGLAQLHTRLVDRRCQVWQGRISRQAADRSLRMYEYMLAGWITGILGVVGFIIATGASVEGADWIVVGGLLCGFGWIAAAFVAGRQAGVEIARQYGLPAASWRRMELKTPAQFDDWLQHQPRAAG